MEHLSGARKINKMANKCELFKMHYWHVIVKIIHTVKWSRLINKFFHVLYFFLHFFASLLLY